MAANGRMRIAGMLRFPSVAAVGSVVTVGMVRGVTARVRRVVGVGCVGGCVVLKKRPRWGLVGLQGERGAARATHPVEGDERVVLHG